MSLLWLAHLSAAALIWPSTVIDSPTVGGTWTDGYGSNQYVISTHTTYCPEGTYVDMLASDAQDINNELYIRAISARCSDGTWLEGGEPTTVNITSPSGFKGSDIAISTNIIITGFMGWGNNSAGTVSTTLHPGSWKLIGMTTTVGTYITGIPGVQMVQFFLGSSPNWRDYGAWTGWCGNGPLPSLVAQPQQCSPNSWIDKLSLTARWSVGPGFVSYLAIFQTMATCSNLNVIPSNAQVLPDAANITASDDVILDLSRGLQGGGTFTPAEDVHGCGYLTDALYGYGGNGAGSVGGWSEPYIDPSWVLKGFQVGNSLGVPGEWWPAATPGVIALRLFFGPRPNIHPVDYLQSIHAGTWADFRWQYSTTPSWTFATVANATAPPTAVQINTYSGGFLQLPPFTFPRPGTFNFSVQGRSDSGENIGYYGSLTVLPFPITVQIRGGALITPCSNALTQLTAQWEYDQTQVYSVLWSGNCAFVGPLNGTVVQVNATLASTPCNATATVQSPTAITNSGSAIIIGPLPLCALAIQGTVVLNSADTIRLVGSVVTPDVSSASLVKFQWTIPPILNSCLTSSDLSTALTSRGLIVGPGCASENMTYAITLTASLATVSLNTNVSLHIRQGPYGGTCVASQPDPASSVLQINCSNWLAETQTSLIYAVYESSNTSGTATPWTPVTGAQVTPVIVVYLLPGLHILEVVISTREGTSRTVLLPVVTLTGQCYTLSNQPANSTGPSLNGNSLAYSVYELSCTQQASSWVGLQNTINSTLTQQQYLTTDDLAMLATAIGQWTAFGVNITAANTGGTSTTTTGNNNNTTTNQTAAQFDVAVRDAVAKFVNLTSDGNALAASLTLQAAVAPIVARGDCNSIVDPILTNLAALNSRTVSDISPGETQSSITTSIGTFEGAAVFGGGGGGGGSSGSSSFFDNSIQFQLPQGTTSSASDNSIVRSTITQYQSTSSIAQRCRTVDQNMINGGKLLVPVSDVSVLNSNGSPQPVVNDNLALEFTLDTPVLCGHPICAWWDGKHGQWSLEGCRGEAVSAGQFKCTCTHLTEFTLLLGGCPTPSERRAYLSLLIIYVLLGIFAVVMLSLRIVRQLMASGRTSKIWRVPHTQHVLTILLCGLRAVTCAVLGQFLVTELFVARASLLMAPYLIVFWIYTILVFGWAELHHFTMKTGSRTKMATAFLLTNFIVLATVITIVVTMTKAEGSAVTTPTVSDSGSKLARAGTLFLAILTALAAAGFLVYSILLRRQLLAHGGSRSVNDAGCCNFNNRLLFFGVVASFLLVAQAAMHVVSGVTPLYGPNELQIVLLFCDVLFIVATLALYFRAMNANPAPSKKSRIALDTVKL